MAKNIEILQKSGVDNYDTVLYPKTKLSNVIYNESLTAEDEVMTILKILKDCKTVSTSYYKCDANGKSIVKINNENYHYLDSILDVYYNGLYLIPDVNYVLEDLNNVRFIDFTLNVNDEITFRVLNSIKINLELDYENMTTDKAKQLKDIVNSINNYINSINNGKELIANEFQKGKVDVNWNDSFEKMAKEVKTLIDSKKSMPNDLGILFSNPYFGIMSTINLGRLFGNSLTSEDFTSDLGSLFGVN